jgi:hypothetical protein
MALLSGIDAMVFPDVPVATHFVILADGAPVVHYLHKFITESLNILFHLNVLNAFGVVTVVCLVFMVACDIPSSIILQLSVG